MILFRVARLDSGDLGSWRRALLPASRLRRRGMAARIVSGVPGAADLAGAAALVLTGAISAEALAAATAARAVGLRIVLDIGDLRALADDGRLSAAAAGVDLVTVANERLAVLAAGRAVSCAGKLRVLPDLAAAGLPNGAFAAAFPAAAIRLAADAARIRAIDAVRRARRRLLDGPPPRQDGPLVAWFGDGAALEDEGGLGELMLGAGALVDLAQDTPYRLRVIGTSRRTYRRTIARLPVVSHFRRFALPNLAGDLAGVDLCFLPGGGDAASLARADARRRIAQGCGVPVIDATEIGGGWEALLRAHLANPAKAVAPRGSEGTDAEDWAETLSGRRAPSAPAVRAQIRKQVRAVFLLQQFQDLDLVCPVAEAACLDPDFDVRVAVLTKIAAPAARRLDLLRQRGAAISFWYGRDVAAGRVPLRAGEVDAAITASDGVGPGSRFASIFVQAANMAGATTFNLQHGLDNAGLTYGVPHRQKKEQFGSRFVLTWGGFARLTSAANSDTRGKVVPVGCTKRQLKPGTVPDFPIQGRPFIAVFENLHWVRYDNSYRARFVQDLLATAAAAPELLFVLKPHMGGRWFTQAQAGQGLPENLVLADFADPQWRRFTADAFLAHAAAVITTPSTIALDAARYDLPVALVTYGIEADNYAPIRRLEGAGDWRAFVEQVRAGKADLAPQRAFLASAIVAGDAVARSLDAIRLGAGGSSQTEILAALGFAPDASTAPA